MPAHSLQKPIEDLWEQRDNLSSATKGEARDAVEAALEALDNGTVRVAEKTTGEWQVNQWLKKAVLMSFRLTDSSPMEGPGGAPVWAGPAACADAGRSRATPPVASGHT